MSLNDKTLNGARGVDVYPGVANPTESSTQNDPLASNFVTDPTTDSMGAGASTRFRGNQEARKNFARTAGVVEGRPGIIESTNIDPLNENSNKDDGWANARTSSNTSSGVNAAAGSALNQAASAAYSAAGMAAGVAKMAYGTAVGDEDARKQGKEAIWGKERP